VRPVSLLVVTHLVFLARALAVLGQRNQALVDGVDARVEGQQRVEANAGQGRRADAVQVVQRRLHEAVLEHRALRSEKKNATLFDAPSGKTTLVQC